MNRATAANEVPVSRPSQFTRRQFLTRALSAGVALIGGCATGGGGDDEETSIARGETLYARNCAGCHGGDGTGGGNFPALAGNDAVTGGPAPVIEIVVEGEGSMPAFGDELDDEEIAAVVSYIRNTWGNDAEVVTAEDVAAAR